MPHEIAHQALASVAYGDEPAVFILADSDAAAERAGASVQRAGCRVSGTAPIQGAVDRLDRQVAMDAALVEIEADAGPELDRLLDHLERAARAQRYASVVSTPAALIDAVAARTPDRRVVQLSGASEAERVAAIAFASVRQPPRLQDIGRDQGPDKLQQLGEEVGRIASILASLSEEAVAGDAGEGSEAEGGVQISAGRIRAIIRARRHREQYFNSAFFADPAWDMLLDLMAARLERKRVAVSSLCIAAAVPPTTALRWIKTLSDHGLFVRHADPQDGRRVYIELSDKAAAAMEAYLKTAERLSPVLI
ncbi:MAG TPA: MarR family winged helix-turn-helix transcriptional regulator [Allosphingosinicella sp.]|nr:MarR family winged helix-turn-helix transcriptional regulator [Allosphingosinicella sp.]